MKVPQFFTFTIALSPNGSLFFNTQTPLKIPPKKIEKYTKKDHSFTMHRVSVLFACAASAAAMCDDFSDVVKFKNSADPPVSLTPEDVSNRMLGWEVDDVQPILNEFHGVQLRPQTKAFFPFQNNRAVLQKDTQYTFHCPTSCSGKPCEVIIANYHCYPCSASSNGGFPKSLPLEGIYKPGHCVPKFNFVGNSFFMVGYRMLLAAGETVSTPLTDKPLLHTFATLRQGAIDCGDLTAGECSLGQTDGECYWSAADTECKSNWCPAPKPGKRPDCSICADSVTLDD